MNRVPLLILLTSPEFSGRSKCPIAYEEGEQDGRLQEVQRRVQTSCAGNSAEGMRIIVRIERDLDLTPGLVYKWQQRYRVQETILQASNARAKQAELRRLKRELEIRQAGVTS